MAKSYNQKIKLLFLMDLFMQKTDIEHTISMKEILGELEKNGISGARKSIYSDIETLKEYGMEIEYSIVSTIETDPKNGKVSNESTLGENIMGHRPGDVVKFRTESDREVVVEILAVYVS